MLFSLITIFPEAFSSYLNSSILKRAQKRGLIKIKFFNPRDFVKDKHKTVDDKPFGGGPGMVMRVLPIVKAAELASPKLKNKNLKVILFSAGGRQFTQNMAKSWAKKYEHLILISGHYEGVDQRVKKVIKAQEISIGPYILTGGELPAMIVIDAVSRHIPDVLGKSESLEEKHGSYPVYTRPEIITYKNKKYKVPKVLLSGNHKNIQKWREKHA